MAGTVTPRAVATILRLKPAINNMETMIKKVTIVVDKSGSLTIRINGTAARRQVMKSLLPSLISSV